MRFFLAFMATAAMASQALAQSAHSPHPMMGRSATSSAMPKCRPGNPVVWLDMSRKTYFTPLSKHYGKATHGKFVCRSSAVAMGAHASKSGEMAHGSMQRRMSAPAAGLKPTAKTSPRPVDLGQHGPGAGNAPSSMASPGGTPNTAASSGPPDRGQHGPGGATSPNPTMSSLPPGSASSPGSTPNGTNSAGPPDRGQHGPGGATSPAPQATNTH